MESVTLRTIIEVTKKIVAVNFHNYRFNKNRKTAQTPNVAGVRNSTGGAIVQPSLEPTATILEEFDEHSEDVLLKIKTSA